MTKIRPIMLLLIGLLLSEARGQRLPWPVLDSLLKTGIDLTLRQEYESALETFRSASREFPDHPAGYLYQMGVLQAIAMDYEEIIKNGEFDSLLSLAQTTAESLIERDPRSPWGYYLLGTALGHDSYARAQRGDWFGTITKGIAAVSKLEEAVRNDSSFTDAFLGIGAYSYWKTRKIEFLTWLPFIRDDRARGIDLLQRCARNGEYGRYAALSALVSIFLDAGEYGKADSVSSGGLAKYPRNRMFLWGRATALEQTGLTGQALEAYKNLLESILSDRRRNRYNELVCRWKLALLSLADNRAADASVYVAGVLNMESEPFPEHLKERAAEKFRRARELAENIAARRKAGDGE